MKRNPCRYCALAYYDNIAKAHIPSRSNECVFCENYRKHMEYLQSQHKFTVGEPITSLDELLNQEFVFWGDKTRHIEVIKSLMLRTVLKGINNKWFYKAIKKESEG